MASTYFLIVLTVSIGFGAWMLFLWAARNGQFEDLERPKYRMLDDEDED
jgi:cbb3-type cytochrome oxidase maturation protein